MPEFSVGQESPPWCQGQVDHCGFAPNFIEIETDNSVVKHFKS